MEYVNGFIEFQAESEDEEVESRILVRPEYIVSVGTSWLGDEYIEIQRTIGEPVVVFGTLEEFKKVVDCSQECRLNQQ